MRANYDRNLNTLHDQLVDMGNLVIASIENSVKALANKDEELAKEVINGDKYIDSLETKIEHQCFNLIMREQPVASDLRFITSALKSITDLERIGDQAGDISSINLKIANRNYEKEDLGSIIQMAEVAKSMVKDAIKALIESDLDLSKEVLTRDDEVDEYFKKVRKEVVKDVKEDKFATKNSLDFLMIAKYLERIGDHAENIAERVHFSITGEQAE